MYPRITKGLTVTLPMPAAAIRISDAHRLEAIGTGGHGWGVALLFHNLYYVVILANGHGTVTQPPGLIHLQDGGCGTVSRQPSLAPPVYTGG